MTIDEARVLVALHGGTARQCAKALLTHDELNAFVVSWPQDSTLDSRLWDRVRRDSCGSDHCRQEGANVTREAAIALLHLVNGHRRAALDLLSPDEYYEWNSMLNGVPIGPKPALRERERDAWIAIMCRRPEEP